MESKDVKDVTGTSHVKLAAEDSVCDTRRLSISSIYHIKDTRQALDYGLTAGTDGFWAWLRLISYHMHRLYAQRGCISSHDKAIRQRTQLVSRRWRMP